MWDGKYCQISTKTTLARAVYDDSVIMYHFDIRVWLTISQDYSSRKVLLGLAHSMKLIHEHMSGEKVDVSVLAVKVYRHLLRRRYLVVMDDVWSTTVWDDMRNVFPDDGNGSQIVLTTRVADLAVYPNITSAPHEMRFMNYSQSWDLLKGKVFAESNCPPDLEEVGKKISRSCGGLLLAVVLVAGFLSEVDKNLSSWDEISTNVLNPVVGQELEEILSLSYTHLNHHLRPCFLFMAMFPEDESISASRLIRLWLASGFLKHENGCSKSVEEEAEKYLEDLVKRNLVIVTRKKSDGKIKCCSLHDMVRDLCIKKAHDERFICVLSDSLVRQDVTNGRHISFINEQHITFQQFHMNDIWSRTIHTILFFHLLNFPSVTSFLRCYRLLRIFDAVSENSISIPSEVFELFHLRYLALTCSSVPSAISNLMNLQTLIILPSSLIAPTFYSWKRYWLSDCGPSHSSLPLEIWSMPQLRHILIYQPYTLPHPPNGSNPPLENLHTVSYIKNLVWNENILLMIPNVKRLGLVYDTGTEFNLNLLKHLDQLEKLKVHGYRGFFWQRKSPNFPSTLKKLTLVGGGLPWEDITSVIGSLPNLQVLKLRDHACWGENWETADGGFSNLEYLLIEISELQHWITERSHFPRLKCLVLSSCRKLREIPEGIGEILTLELIEVDHNNESVVKSAKQIKEDQESYGNYGLHICVTHSHEIRRNSLHTSRRGAIRAKMIHGVLRKGEDW